MQIWAILNPKTSQQRHFGGCVRSLRGHERLKGHGTNWYHLSGFPILFHPFPLAARMTQQHVPAGSTKVSLWRTRFFQPNWSYKRPWIEKWKGMWNQQPMGLSPSFPTQTIGAIMNYDSIICYATLVGLQTELYGSLANPTFPGVNHVQWIYPGASMEELEELGS